MIHSPTKTLPVIASLLGTATYAVNAQSDSEERAVGAFSRLAAQDGIDVRLTQANETRMRIEVEGYELADIISEVVDGELRLSNRTKHGFSFFRARGGEVAVYLDVVDLSAIRASGGSDASLRASASVVISASGGSDVDVQGDPARRRVNNDRSSGVACR